MEKNRLGYGRVTGALAEAPVADQDGGDILMLLVKPSRNLSKLAASISDGAA